MERKAHCDNNIIPIGERKREKGRRGKGEGSKDRGR